MPVYKRKITAQLKNPLRILTAGIVTSLFALLCSADESTFEPGLDISLERAHQSFKNVSGTDITTVSITPYLQDDKWFFTLDVPWQSVDGEYVLNNRQTNIPAICETVASASPQQLANISQRRQNFSAVIDRCNALTATGTDSSSGLSDIAVYGSYAVPLDKKNIWYLLLTTGMQWDNADWENGIGSGTQDLIGELTLSADNSQWLGSITVGYNAILGGELDPYYDNYAYITADIGARLTDILTAGVQTEWTESSSFDDKDATSASLYLSAAITKKLRLRLTYKRFSDLENYPEKELRGSLRFSF